MSKASTETFLEQVRSGNTLTDKQLIYLEIKKNPGITLLDLKRKLKIQHQTVSARLSELMDLGIVEILATQTRIGVIKLSYDSILIAQEDEKKINSNILERNEKRFQKALKSLLSFDNHLEPELKEQLAKHLKVKL